MSSSAFCSDLETGSSLLSQVQQQLEMDLMRKLHYDFYDFLVCQNCKTGIFLFILFKFVDICALLTWGGYGHLFGLKLTSTKIFQFFNFH
jgi:hypothetical protein